MALLFDIKRYSVNDGPGIRITFFFKGCPLTCIWCHNPEGTQLRQQKLYTESRCIGCRTCSAACPEKALIPLPDGMATDATRCLVCGRCANVCPTKAMEISGMTLTPDHVMAEIEKERVFLEQSGGGVTFCGGEPLMQSGFLYKLLRRCRNADIRTAVDTTLFCPEKKLRVIMAYVDLFLVDLKHMDTHLHHRYCGVFNRRILNNIRLLAIESRPFLIRIPLIEGINTDEGNIRASASFLASLPWTEKTVQLLPYHDIGKGKHAKLGTVYNPANIPMSTPSASTIASTIHIFESFGISATVGG
ncbi:MAG: glycyl-radical enzyme activating protein [Tannerellaceae bacterium]|jgi:pyruvate formate lyase activating enzyme|nr:glycyl-radical enzyme activating protein [Tannerellaceae bacterium]